MFGRLLRGDPRKNSRFRDFADTAPPFSAWLYLPLSFVTTVIYRVAGWRPVLPWLGFRAIRRIGQLVSPGTKVLEFGSGMSTLWFAKRGVQLVSIEADARWHAEVERRLRWIPGHQVRCILASPPYAGIASSLGGPFDLALIDGEARDLSAELALALLRPGGYAYLDNADAPERAHRDALARLLASGSGEWFTDFTPCQVFVSTGVLVKTRPEPGGA